MARSEVLLSIPNFLEFWSLVFKKFSVLFYLTSTYKKIRVLVVLGFEFRAGPLPLEIF
jgi:hypothetical protein